MFSDEGRSLVEEERTRDGRYTQDKDSFHCQHRLESLSDDDVYLEEPRDLHVDNGNDKPAQSQEASEIEYEEYEE